MLALRHKLEIGGAVLALGLIGIATGSWLSAREDGIRLKATLDAQNGVIATASKNEAARDAALAQTQATLEGLKKATQTPAEVVKALPQVLPLPQPITIALPPSQGQTPPSKGDSAPVQGAIVPAADLKPLFDFATTCKECQAKVAALTQDKSDDETKIVALTKERDAAVTAAKGGSKWSRIKKAAKWVAIGVGIGAVGAIAAHK